MSVADPLYLDRLDALEQTWQAWSQLGGSLSEALWSAVSRCPGWDVACLYAHHSQFLLALSAPPPPAPEVSGQPQSAAQVLRAFNAPDGVASTAGPAVADQAARDAVQHQPAEPVELEAAHWFDIETAAGATVLRHTVEGSASGKYDAIWRERIEPLHDLILEALLDNVQAEATGGSFRAASDASL